MTRTFRPAIPTVVPVVVLYLCLGFLLPGCVTLRPNPDCPNPLGPSCQLLVSQRGIYEVRYLDERGQETTGGFRPNSSGFINICDCQRILSSEPVELESDLAVTMFASHDPVIVGELVTYSINVSSDAQSTEVSSLTIDIRPPPERSILAPVSFTFSSNPGSTFDCGLNNEFISCSGRVTCGPLDPIRGNCATVTVAVRPTEPGTLTATVRATTTDLDLNGNNNVAVLTTTVRNAEPISADLSVIMTDSPDPVRIGQPLVYTITIRNNGPDGATGVRLIDLLPATLAVTRVETSQGTFSMIDQALVFEVGTLVIGAEATITIEVNPNATGSVTNSAFVTATESDPNRGNNNVLTTTTVNP